MLHELTVTHAIGGDEIEAHSVQCATVRPASKRVPEMNSARTQECLLPPRKFSSLLRYATIRVAPNNPEHRVSSGCRFFPTLEGHSVCAVNEFEIVTAGFNFLRSLRRLPIDHAGHLTSSDCQSMQLQSSEMVHGDCPSALS